MKIELHHEDCLEGMRKLPEGCVDTIVTSPPYNIGAKYATYKDRRQQVAYYDWCEQWGKQIYRVLKPDGSFFLNVGGSSANPTLPHDLVVMFSDSFKLQNTIIWAKSLTAEIDGKEVSVGHFKPVNSQRFVNSCHEFVFHFTKTGSVQLDRLAVGVEYQDKSNINRWGHTNGKDKRCRGSIWYVPYETIQNRDKERPHPATFPARLASNCIKLHGVRSDLSVMDPFMGLGAAGLAAQECGADRFIGYEIDPGYFEIARERLSAR
jgi:site-specific DNA-methyltransferase (adenine-specific)